MSGDSIFALIQQNMSRCGLTMYTVLSNIGLLFNMAVFSQPTHRRNPSSMYILAMFISAFLGLNASTNPVIYEVERRDPVLLPQLHCQIQLYFRHSLNQIMQSFFILARIDRYIISSDNQRIRSFSSYRIAFYAVPCVVFCWLLLPLFPTLLRSAMSGVCATRNNTDTIIFLVCTLITVSLLSFSCMILFTILFHENLNKMRVRTHTLTHHNHAASRVLGKRDRDIIRTLLIEVLCYIGTTGT